MVHQGETIITTPVTQMLTNIANNGGAGGNVTHNHTWNISGGPNASPKDIADQVIGTLNRYARLNHVRM